MQVKRMTHRNMLKDSQLNSQNTEVPGIKINTSLQLESTYIHIKAMVIPTLYSPKVNASFTTNEDIDWTILHHRFDRIKYEKLARMCAEQSLHG